MNEAEPVLAELARGERQRNGTPGDLQSTGVRCVKARENFNQGRLPRTVLPEQPMDLPTSNLKARLIERLDTAKALGNADESQGGRIIVRPP